MNLLAAAQINKTIDEAHVKAKRTKLTDNVRADIKAKLLQGETTSNITYETGVGSSTVNQIRKSMKPIVETEVKAVQDKGRQTVARVPREPKRDDANFYGEKMINMWLMIPGNRSKRLQLILAE